VKAIYLEQVHRALDRRFPEAFPEYEPWPLKLTKEERRAATLFKGSRLYGRRVPEGALFLHLIPHRRQESFHAEVGWSVSGRFPVALSSHGPITKPADDVRKEPDWLVQFGELYYGRHRRNHLGWEVWRPSVDVDHPDYMRIFVQEDLAPVSEAQARERAEAAVEAAVKDLKEVAIPYLDEWVRSRASVPPRA
jgi:hypothetical protein